MNLKASKSRGLMALAFLFLVSTPCSQAQKSEAGSPIYSADTIVWFGVDLSLFRLSNAKKVGTEEEIRPFLADWVQAYNTSFPNVKMASMLKRKKVWLDTAYTASSYESNLPERFVVAEEYDVDDNDLADYIREIPTLRTGIGLIYIIENLFKGESGPGDEVPSEVRGSFVWFNIDTREVLHIETSVGTPRTAYFTGSGAGYNQAGGTVGRRKGAPAQRGFEGYWLQGMIDATTAFTLVYKDNLPKANTQY